MRSLTTREGSQGVLRVNHPYSRKIAHLALLLVTIRKDFDDEKESNDRWKEAEKG